MNLQPRNQRNHHCTIIFGSNSCLPKLSPTAGKFPRLWRTVRKQFLVSEFYDDAKYHFKSTAAIFSERRRHLTYPSYIIHPFSTFAYYRECVMFFIWFVKFVISPLNISFPEVRETEQRSKITSTAFEWHNLPLLVLSCYLVDTVLLVNGGLYFVSGYHEFRTKETVLSPKQIAIRYLKTYFVWDLIGSFPAECFVMQKNQFHFGPTVFIVLKHSCLLPRMRTMFQYFRNITVCLKIGDAMHEVVCVILISFFLMHYCSCIAYMSYAFSERSNLSWIALAKLERRSVGLKYAWSMYTAMVHFYRSGPGTFQSESLADNFILSLVMILGSVYFSYVVVIILQAIGTANASVIKYEQLMQQLYDYMRCKSIPTHINLRLRKYYENRFQKRYFREQAILATLSEHLRHEIKFYTCR